MKLVIGSYGGNLPLLFLFACVTFEREKGYFSHLESRKGRKLLTAEYLGNRLTRLSKRKIKFPGRSSIQLNLGFRVSN